MGCDSNPDHVSGLFGNWVSMLFLNLALFMGISIDPFHFALFMFWLKIGIVSVNFGLFLDLSFQSPKN